tara:strand:- start:67 stop:324 length:258 start_codon:yes stop_codon:yes gene_type:complete
MSFKKERKNSLSGGISWEKQSEEYKKQSQANSLKQGMKSLKHETTNRQFSSEDGFIKACEKIGIKPTKRQASKFRRKEGKAYDNR